MCVCVRLMIYIDRSYLQKPTPDQYQLPVKKVGWKIRIIAKYC